MKISRIKRNPPVKNNSKSSASYKSLSSYTSSTRSSVTSSKGLLAQNSSSTDFKFSTISQPDKHITVRYSLSPSKCTIFDPIVQPKEYTSLISFQSIDTNLTQCNPYELRDEKRLRKINSTLRSKNFDLTPGIFSKKQIVSESNIKKSIFCPFDVSDSTELTSNTPSPTYKRNTRCSFLSKNFKINKKLLPSQLVSSLLGFKKVAGNEMYPKGQPIKITRIDYE